MRFSTTLVVAALYSGKGLGVLATKNSFAGTNNYFLHALKVDQQEQYIQKLSSWGTKVMRLWVTGASNHCEKGSLTNALPQYEEEVGTYKPEVLEALDVTLSILHKNGIKAIISPHDAGKLKGNNGCDAYCNKYGASDDFYNSAEAAIAYDARLKSILNHKSTTFGGKRWGDLDEVIMAFDIQNEPMIGSVSILKKNDPNRWLAKRAKVIKELIGSKTSIKVATGGIGGSHYCCDHEYNLLPAALDSEHIDIMSVHSYMSNTKDWAYFVPKLAVQAEAKGKKLMIEEWGVAVSYNDKFDAQVKLFNDKGIPWLYWQFIPGFDATQAQSCTGECCNVATPNFDGFEIGLDSGKGGVKAALSAALNAKAAQDWSGYL